MPSYSTNYNLYLPDTADNVDVASSLKTNFTTIDDKMFLAAGIYNVKGKPYSAKGDGGTDDTDEIQACMNDCASVGGGFVFIPKGTYMIDAIKCLNVPSNIKIVFHPQAVLKAINTNAGVYSILKLNGVSNVVIEGNFASIVGDRDTNTFVGGEGGMCVRITDCTNIYIQNLIATKGYGDGFYVGTNINSYNKNIYLINCIADNNRRNGLSITSVKNMLVLGGEYKNTAGTNPQFGIDVEPNANCIIQNVQIKGVKTTNNVEGGIALIPILMKGSANTFDVTIEDWLSESDGTSSSVSYGVGLLLDNDSSTNAQVYGKIKINKASIISPNAIGVYIQGWCLAPKTSLHDVVVYNSNTDQISYAPSQAAFGMDYNSGDPTGVNFGNITFERCGTIDTRATKLTKYAFAFLSTSDRPFNNIVIIDPIFEGILSTWISWGVPNTSSGLAAKFNLSSVANVSASTALTGYIGQEVVATAAVTLTLPGASVVQGAEITVRYGAASGTVNLVISGSDTVINKGAAVTSIALTMAGTFVKVRSIGANKWIVVDQNIS